MSIHFRQGKLQGQERIDIIQDVQKQAKAAALAAIQPLMTVFLQAEQQVKLWWEKGELRRVSSQPREIDWQCGHCGCHDANHFTRDGHYRRTLAMTWGQMEGLQVPMLECQCCGHDMLAGLPFPMVIRQPSELRDALRRLAQQVAAMAEREH